MLGFILQNAVKLKHIKAERRKKNDGRASQLITTTKTMAENATMVTVTTATRAIGCNRRGYVTNNKLLRLSKGLVLRHRKCYDTRFLSTYFLTESILFKM